MYILPLSLLFFILLGIDLYSETTQTNAVSWIVRPLLMLMLLILFLLNAHNTLCFERIFVIISLIFSCLGDILLIIHRDNFFIFGLVSFLIAHISYIISFLIRLRHEGDALRQRLTILAMIIISLPFLVYIAFMLYILCPKLIANTEGMKDLIAPVVVYTFVIVSMAYISCLRNRKFPGFWFVFIGAIFFVLSDTLLAFNKFVVPLSTPGLFVIFTYGIGQYLIIIGTDNDFRTGYPVNDKKHD